VLHQHTRTTEKPEAPFHLKQQLILGLDVDERSELLLTPGGKLREALALLPGLACQRPEIRRERNSRVERLPGAYARCARRFIARQHDLLATLRIDDRERSTPSPACGRGPG